MEVISVLAAGASLPLALTSCEKEGDLFDATGTSYKKQK